MTTVHDTPTSSTTNAHHDPCDLPLRDRICKVAVEHFGRFGFDQSMLEMSIANDVDVATLSELFGSIEGMRKACDEYVEEAIRIAKTEALSSREPGTWLSATADIGSFAPIMSYLVRALQSGDQLSRRLMQQMVDNAETYLESAVRTGTIKPTRDPKARARFLAMCGGGSFLLYLLMHETPGDMDAVLRDYARDMMMPALELYTEGLMTDDTMYKAFLSRAERSEEAPQHESRQGGSTRGCPAPPRGSAQAAMT